MVSPPAFATPSRRLTRRRPASIAASHSVTTVARLGFAKFLLKHAHRSISRPIQAREISMPPSKPQLSLQSPSQTPLLLSLRRRQAHQQPFPNTTELKPAVVSRRSGASLGARLQAAVRLEAAARRACLSSCLMLLSWLVSEFLDGCATYALTMYGIPASLDDRLADASEPKLLQSDQARGAAPCRPQLAIVSSCAEAHDDRPSHT
jgi:hypothetical protein